MAPQQKYVDWKIVGTLKPSPQLDLIIRLSDGLKVPLILLVFFEPKPSWSSFLIPVEIIILLFGLNSYNKKEPSIVDSSASTWLSSLSKPNAILLNSFTSMLPWYRISSLFPSAPKEKEPLE